METRFGALNFLCKLQVFIGSLIIVGAAIFFFYALVRPDSPEGTLWTAALIAAALVMLGLGIIATAQVYQCLMQIEINTRREQALPPPQVDAQHPCPKCNSGRTEIYERSREGEGWICRACNHTWLVSP